MNHRITSYNVCYTKLLRDSTATEAPATEQVQEAAPTTEEAAVVAEATDDQTAENVTFTQELKKRFIEGGPGFMGIVLICLILGLAIAIERIIYLNLSTTNTKKLVSEVEDALNSGGVEAAKEVTRNTRNNFV